MKPIKKAVARFYLSLKHYLDKDKQIEYENDLNTKLLVITNYGDANTNNEYVDEAMPQYLTMATESALATINILDTNVVFNFGSSTTQYDYGVVSSHRSPFTGELSDFHVQLNQDRMNFFDMCCVPQLLQEIWEQHQSN